MSSDVENRASAEERAQAQAKALHHIRLMARLQNEVDAIEEIRRARQQRESSRKRLRAKVGAFGMALFVAGLGAGVLSSGKITINFVDGLNTAPRADAQLRPQLVAPPPPLPSSAPSTAVVSPLAASAPSGWTAGNELANPDAERVSVTSSEAATAKPLTAPIPSAGGTSVQPTLPHAGQGRGFSSGPVPMPSLSPLPAPQPKLRMPLPAAMALPRGQPSLPPPLPMPPLPTLPATNRLSGLPAPNQASKPPESQDGGKDAAGSAIDVVLRDRSTVNAQEPSRTPVPVQKPEAPSAALTPTANQSYKIMQYLDGYVLVRVGNRVATVRVGERLPDGRLLKAVSDASITTE